MRLQDLYDCLLRPHLPRKIGVFNGVAVRHPRLLDRTDENWSHKAGMVRQLGEAIDPGDRIVEVGSGMGVLTVRAARATTRHGEVYGYEAGKNRVTWGRETLGLNGVTEWASIEHALIEGGDVVWGEIGEPGRISVSELPEYDVLVTDCDGGERPILSELTPEAAPRAAVIESHGMYGASTDWVTDRLTELGLMIQDTRPASTNTPGGDDNMAVLATRE